MTAPFDPDRVLRTLTPFQRATVAHVERRFFDDDEPTRRYLVADETGLGKSLVAKGLIARTIERLRDEPSVDRIDILYVCSSTDIADQNLRHLDILDTGGTRHASRLTLLAKDSGNLRGEPHPDIGKRVNLVSFTPGTSFSLGHSYGQIDERALLYILLRDELGFGTKERRRAEMILRGTAKKGSLCNRVDAIEWQMDQDRADDRTLPDPTIVEPFITAARCAGLLDRFEQTMDDIGRRTTLGDHEWVTCRDLVGELRNHLARCATDALEPDLIILDEFQRFRHVLDRNERTHAEAAELAHSLFEYEAARVLLLSATPYKPFTYSEEAAVGDDHATDLKRIIGFLADDGERVASITTGLRNYRDAIIDGRDTTSLRTHLEQRLTDLMCRTERPKLGDDDMLDERADVVTTIEPDDICDYARLAALARHVDAPMPIDYWKSTPYFLNFGDGYKFTERLRDALDNGTINDLAPLLKASHLLDAGAVERLGRIDPHNSRTEQLIKETLGGHGAQPPTGWAQLLWLPPSLPYEPFGGPFTDVDAPQMTKRLIFSSWTATPTAIASLLSHEATRQLAGDANKLKSAKKNKRLSWSFERSETGTRARAMTTMALFWPSPALARSTSPFTGDHPLPLAGQGPENAERWYWSEIFGRGNAVPAALTLNTAIESLSHLGDDDAPETGSRGLAAHVDFVYGLHCGEVAPESVRSISRPDDLDDVLVHIARYAPGNIALRCIDRLAASGTTSEVGRWQAAAVISNALRSLFNRPEASLLLDNVADGAVTWRAVLMYCRWGNLEAVLDEYLHHLSATQRAKGFTDTTLLEVAEDARTAITPRPSRYEAFDPRAPDQRIKFTARFALRYGTKKGTLADGARERPQEVRAAFNSPFWPFVLATTSVGQEGIDFHWWCRNATHWNIPASPVDFEQREGRVHRYGGLAIRRNVATQHHDHVLAAAATGEHPWDAAYRIATEHLHAAGDSDDGGLKPHWITPGHCGVIRQLYLYPLSRDVSSYDRLIEDLTLYRLTFGQPRQEDLLELMRRRGVHRDATAIKDLRLDLSPPAVDHTGSSHTPAGAKTSARPSTTHDFSPSELESRDRRQLMPSMRSTEDPMS